MKYLTCILTFLSYSSLHTLRMCYSFNKFYVKREFLLTDFYLGVLDGLVYLSLGIGTLMRYTLIRSPFHLTETYLATSIFAAMSIAVISVLGLVADYENIIELQHYELFKILITVALIVFGFMQLTSRPIVTSLLGSALKTEQNGCLIGAWATHTNAGHISGLLLSNLLVHTFQLKWQVSIFIGAIICILTALLVYFVLQNPLQKNMDKPVEQLQVEEKEEIQQQLRKHSSRQFYSFIKQMLKSTNYKYYIPTMTIIKAMVYTFLLWFPIYLDSVKLKRYSGYITILFEVGAILGSLLLGKLYDYEGKKYMKTAQNSQQRQEDATILEKIASAKSLISLVTMTIIVLIFYFSVKSIVGYCIFSLSVGFFLGGTANTLNSNDILHFAQNDVRKLDYLTNFNVGLGSCFVGFIQLMVGIALYEQNQVGKEQSIIERRIAKSHHSYKVLFIILLALGGLVSIIFFLKLFVKKDKNHNGYSYDSLQQQ